jgi:hypothetical protein
VTTVQGKYEVMENITKWEWLPCWFLIWHWSWEAGGFLCFKASWLSSSLVVLLHYFLNSVYSSSCISLHIYERLSPYVYPFRMPDFLCSLLGLFCSWTTPSSL